ncbi:SPOR domain-containing protein [Modicisalibacter coralii]|uniref:SPOR domain-containing protein n=1 Tax=Modicisalibacter coralii TaxID=2304602 RepID=UPI00100B8BB8|nr:SPOR domain-containing protein [Halomonas coralii]
MKYGMRERISGAVILLALGVIFVPMLFDEPPAREERPQPSLTIDQPIDVEQAPVEAPEPPSSLGQIQSPQASSGTSREPAASGDEAASQSAPSQAVSQPKSDPIAEIARNAEQQGERGESSPEASQSASEPDAQTPSSPTPATTENGDWAVQVGSFGEPGNAERLEKKLNAQGFHAYSRPRDNNLTSVYIGPFASSEAGEKARAALKEKVNIQGLLIRVQEGG